MNNIPYHEWIDVRLPEDLEQVKRNLNSYEMVAYISKTRSKWSCALFCNNKFIDFSGPFSHIGQEGRELIPQYIMRLNVDNFNRETDDAIYIIQTK